MSSEKMINNIHLHIKGKKPSLNDKKGRGSEFKQQQGGNAFINSIL